MTVPLPGVEWLFVHGTGGIGTIEVLRDDPSAAAADVEGYATVPETVTAIRGYVALASEEERAWGATLGAAVEAVVACPRGTAVDHTDRVRVTGVDPYLDGTYRITATRVTPVHLRVLMGRVRDAAA